MFRRVEADVMDLSVGLVGCGLRATEAHLPAYRETDLPVAVAAVCDLDREAAERVSTDFDVPTTYDDVSEMLAGEDLDVVDVCVPPRAHTEVTLEAIRSGCHVLVEKPLALDTAECDAMIRAADEHDVKLGVMHNMLHNEPIVAARRRLAAGDIGDLTGIRILLTNPREDLLGKSDHWYHDLPGGVMTETLPHISYLALDLMGSVDDVRITAKQAAGLDWAPHDEFDLSFENASVTCSTRLSYSGPTRTMRIDLLGTDGYLQVDVMDNALYTYDLREMDALSLGLHSLGQLGQRVWNLFDNVTDVVTGGATVGSTVVLEAFLESVLHDGQPLVDGEDGRAAVAVLEETVQRYASKYSRDRTESRQTNPPVSR
jgi:predicted dehydrogenase